MTEDYEPRMPQPTLAHWWALIEAAAESRESLVAVPVESLNDLLAYAANSSDVIHDAGLEDVVSSETDADVRQMGRPLRLVREGDVE